MQDWAFSAGDDRLARELQARIPNRVFDAHAHLYRVADLQTPHDNLTKAGPTTVNLEEWRRSADRQLGAGCCIGGLLFAMPNVGHLNQVDGANEFLLQCVAASPDSRGLLVVHPEYSREQAEQFVEHEQVSGFKVYHTFSPNKPTFDAPLESFIPQWTWQLADQTSGIIMLHLVKSLAVADPDNQAYIREMCAAYPQAQLVLAHAGRGFHAPNTRAGLSALRGFNNIWFDTSAICEADPFVAILEEFGPRRLMWGSDFPVSESRGKCVTLGDGFAWLLEDTVAWDAFLPHGQPLLVGLESLRALFAAIDRVGLSADDTKDVFCDNALRMLSMLPESDAAGQKLYDHARVRIPGGTQLLSKRPEQLAPGQWPAYFREARGYDVRDLDGRHFVDMGTNGIGACLLGYRDPDVTQAVKRRLTMGAMSSLNPPEEIELADLLCEIHPWATRVRFARTGGEALAVAVRIARATTGRSVVAICGYHGWHDWYLAANLGDSDRLDGHLLPGLEPSGVPSELSGTAHAFTYNSLPELQTIVREHGERLAAVVMEPCRNQEPDPGFLEGVRAEANRCGALLLFDEITIGWRLHYGGAHLKFGVNPDISVFAKALGNGHPMAAVIGTESAMEGAHRSFISSTYWTESIGPTAALAAVRKMGTVNVPAHVTHIGSLVSDAWREHGKKYNLPVHVSDTFACLAHFRFKHPQAAALRTLYTQCMLDRGFLAGAAIYPTLAHNERIVQRYDAAIDDVFAEIRRAIATDRIEERLKGPIAHEGFRRLT